jgi:hypothetical protein
MLGLAHLIQDTHDIKLVLAPPVIEERLPEPPLAPVEVHEWIWDLRRAGMMLAFTRG